MAWLQRDPSLNDHLSFRLGGSRFKRSLKTKDEAEAETIRRRVEETIVLIDRGKIEVPTGVDLPTFLISDGKLAAKPKVEKVLTFGILFDRYFDHLPEGNLEESTLKGMDTHKRHLFGILGSGTSVAAL